MCVCESNNLEIAKYMFQKSQQQHNFVVSQDFSEPKTTISLQTIKECYCCTTGFHEKCHLFFLKLLNCIFVARTLHSIYFFLLVLYFKPSVPLGRKHIFIFSKLYFSDLRPFQKIRCYRARIVLDCMFFKAINTFIYIPFFQLKP